MGIRYWDSHHSPWNPKNIPRRNLQFSNSMAHPRSWSARPAAPPWHVAVSAASAAVAASVAVAMPSHVVNGSSTKNPGESMGLESEMRSRYESGWLCVAIEAVYAVKTCITIIHIYIYTHIRVHLQFYSRTSLLWLQKERLWVRSAEVPGTWMPNSLSDTWTIPFEESRLTGTHVQNE